MGGWWGKTGEEAGRSGRVVGGDRGGRGCDGVDCDRQKRSGGRGGCRRGMRASGGRRRAGGWEWTEVGKGTEWTGDFDSLLLPSDSTSTCVAALPLSADSDG